MIDFLSDNQFIVKLFRIITNCDIWQMGRIRMFFGDENQLKEVLWDKKKQIESKKVKSTSLAINQVLPIFFEFLSILGHSAVLPMVRRLKSEEELRPQIFR